MNAEIIQFLGFEPHWETDHTSVDMSNIIGSALYRVRYDDGTEEELFTGLRPGENSGWNLKVVDAAQIWRNACGVIPEWTPPTLEELREAIQPLSARQFRLGLLDAGRRIAQVEAAIASIADDTERAKAEVEWEYATMFNRVHPLVVSLSVALGFSPEDLDALWKRALQF